MNAILNKNQADIEGATIYTSLYPCNECAKLVIQSGIKRVVFATVKLSFLVVKILTLIIVATTTRVKSGF